MYFSFRFRDEKFYSWGLPAGVAMRHLRDVKEDRSVRLYGGEPIDMEDTTLLLNSHTRVAVGDSIWLISYLRDWYRWRAQRRGRVRVGLNARQQDFFRTFLPRNFEFTDRFVPEIEFQQATHHLPGLLFGLDAGGGNKMWLLNRSVVSWLYQCAGLEFAGLPDWGEFSPPEIMDPPDAFYERIGVPRGEKFIFFQANSTSRTRTMAPSLRLKLARHLLAEYKLPVYLVDSTEYNEEVAALPGVRSFNGKLQTLDLFTLAFLAELIVSPDTVGIHLGEAYRRPTVGVCGPTAPYHMAWGYQIPALLFGEGFCPNKPCGHTSYLPRKTKCPDRRLDFCAVLTDINLAAFDRAVARTRENAARQHWAPPRQLFEHDLEPAIMQPPGERPAK